MSSGGSSGGSSEESQPELKAKKPRHQTDEDISDSDDIPDSSGSTISTNSKPLKKKNKKDKKRVRSSTTAKQEKKALERRVIEKQHGHHGHKLMKRWLCDSNQCQNRTHYYWQPHGPDDIAGKHFRLNTQDISRWNSALGKRKRGVTVEAPSERLQQRLIKFYKLAHSARKKKPESEVQSITSPQSIGASPSVGASSSQQPFSQQQWQAPFMGQQQYSPFQPTCYSNGQSFQ